MMKGPIPGAGEDKVQQLTSSLASQRGRLITGGNVSEFNLLKFITKPRASKFCHNDSTGIVKKNAMFCI